MNVFFHPPVIEILARDHEEIHPLLLLRCIHARIALDGILQRQQHFHTGQAGSIAARNGIRDRINHEPGTDSVQDLRQDSGP